MLAFCMPKMRIAECKESPVTRIKPAHLESKRAVKSKEGRVY